MSGNVLDVTQNTITTSLKPPLKWAGGKRWLVPYVRPIWEKHSQRRLIEPFSGGLAVTLAMMPARALLNDINPHAINFYRWLKRGFRIEIPMENDTDLYYKHRARFNQLIVNGGVDTKEAAELFYFLNRTGYNGLCRFNRKGEFNVPFGRYTRISYTRDFSNYADVLANWEFSSVDFEKVPLNADDFVYADPPYDVEFTQYSKEGFGWEDQIRLAEWLARHPGPVVLSNQKTKRVVKLYRELGFDLEFHNAPRMINCTGDRSPAKEVLAIKGV
jgi:DNA adenine methylase